MINGIISYNLQHGRWITTFRISGFVNDRTDRVRPTSSNTFYNGMLGIGERAASRTYLSVDFGKTLLYNYLDERISDINSYNASVTCDILKNKLQMSAIAGNSQAMSSVWASPQVRKSLILRIKCGIINGLSLDLEGGWQPFEDRNMPVNNYQDGYVYARMSYDFFVSNRPP